MNKKIFFFACFFISYLLFNTGLVSDELVAIVSPAKDLYVGTPLLYITHYIWYPFLSYDHQAVLNVLKIFYVIVSFYMVFKFFTVFSGRQTAVLASLLFIFYPSHDASTYMFMSQYLTISGAAYLYSYYLAEREKLLPAFLTALAASFLSYGSTPLALALTFLFLLKKKPRQAAALFIPNVLYAIYFVPLNILMRAGNPRIIETFSVSAFFRQFVLQVLTLADAIFGPSAWLKIYFSFFQLTLVSVFVGCVFLLFILPVLRERGRGYEPKLIAAFLVMLFFSSAMFAATGRYPQIVFGLGNRVTIYGSLLAAYLVAMLPMPRVRALVVAVMIFSALGIADHWKRWSVHQSQIILSLKKNTALAQYGGQEPVFFSRNQYSRFGPFSHIEFFSEDWVPAAGYELSLGRSVDARSLNRRHSYENNFLIDTKYGTKKAIGGQINVYDSASDSFFRLDSSRINAYIGSLPVERRHWLQYAGIECFKGIVVRLMPRLRYAF